VELPKFSLAILFIILLVITTAASPDLFLIALELSLVSEYLSTTIIWHYEAKALLGNEKLEFSNRHGERA
jgi:hypothetical protein